MGKTTALAIVTPDLKALAKEINAEHHACERSVREGLTRALRVGQLLIEAKRLHPHGGWLKWVRENCEFSARLAQRYTQIAREVPKLDSTNTTRVSHLSFRQALELTGRNSQALSKLEPDVQGVALEVAETEIKAHGLVARGVCVAKRRALAEALTASEALVISAPFTASWSALHKAALEEQIQREPAFAKMEKRLGQLRAERDELVAKLEANEHEQERLCMELHSQLHAEIEKRHGPIVYTGEASIRPADGDAKDCSTWWAVPVARDVYDEIAGMEEGPERDEKVLDLVDRCRDCRSHLSSENAGVPDEPGMVFCYCHWCRDHRGKTHCNYCGRPLSPGEDFECAECVAYDEAEEEDSDRDFQKNPLYKKLIEEIELEVHHA
jgi:cell division protein FtsB